MTARCRHGPTIHATLCEIERGLFFATYRTNGSLSKLDDLPTYQPGTCAADAKQRIGQSAQGLGFDRIIWEDASVVPPALSRGRSARP